MPSEPMREPTIEQLSAFLDHELDPPSQSAVAGHVATCAECQGRLEGLRQTAYAIRGLPMETPPRSFAVPPERSATRWNWAPAGWIGGVALAGLLIAVGLTHLPAGGSANSASSSNGGGTMALSRQAQQPQSPAGAVAAPYDQRSSIKSHQAVVLDPSDPSRSLSVSTDQATYTAAGTMIVTASVTGDSSQQLTFVFHRGSYGVTLPKPALDSSQPAFGFRGAYRLSALLRLSPPTGGYTLTVTWTESSGATLIADLPIAIAG